MSSIAQVRWLGLVDYEEGLRLQQAFFEARRQNLISDTVFLLEHAHVITTGRHVKESNNLLAPPELLNKLDIKVFPTGRGGDITYHGPGQLVGYPIINLAPDRCDVHKYVRDLEEVMIRTAKDFGIEATRISGLTGIWVGKEKLAAIGVRISRWITMHGFAFNVDTNLDYFKFIVPCGITDKGVTSLNKLLDEKVSLETVRVHLAKHFGEIFEREMEIAPIKHESVQVVIFDDSGPEVEYLLLRRIPERGDFWQPVTGGIKVKKEEAPEAAARREAEEETSLRGELIDLNYIHSFYLEPHLMKKSYPDPQINREYAYALRTLKREVKLSAKEHYQYEWLKFDEAYQRLIWHGNKHALKLTQTMLTNK